MSKLDPSTGPWLAGKEGMEKNMEISIMVYMGTTIWIHSFIPTKTPKTDKVKIPNMLGTKFLYTDFSR